MSDGRTLGQRFAEGIAAALGTWRFIGGQNSLIALWMLWNTLGPVALRFDPAPFIALNLVMSWQAANATPVLLMAGNRQAERDRGQWARIERLERDLGAVMTVVRAVLEETQRAELANLADHGRMLRELHGVVMALVAEKAETVEGSTV